MLSSTTCVGLRYGLLHSLFLEVASPGCHLRPQASVYCPGLPPGSTHNSVCAHRLHASVTFVVSRYGNVDPLSIDFPFRVRLRSRLTLF